MKIVIYASEPKLIVMHGDKDLQFDYSVWGKLRQQNDEWVLGLTNMYLATLPEASQQAIFDEYTKAFTALNDLFCPSNQKVNVISKCVKEIYKHLNWDDLVNFCSGRVEVDNNFSTINNTSNQDDMTYLRDELYQLCMFCVFIKVLLPMLGTLTKRIEKDFGNRRKELIAASTLWDSGFDTLAPYKRLMVYVDALSNRNTKLLYQKDKNIGDNAVAHGLPLSDLTDWRMGVCLIRRLLIYPVNRIDLPPNKFPRSSPLIAIIYTVLLEQFENLTKGAFKDKSESSSGTEDDSVVSVYRIVNPIDRGTFVVMSEYAKDISTICDKLDLPKDYTEMANKLYKLLINNKNYILSNFHFTYMALALKPVYPVTILKFLHLEQTYALTAVCIAYYEYHGYPAISALLAAVRMESSPGVISDIKFNRLPADLITEADGQYQSTNFGAKETKSALVRVIDRIQKEITEYEWAALPDISLLGIETANAVINRPWKRAPTFN